VKKNRTMSYGVIKMCWVFEITCTTSKHMFIVDTYLSVKYTLDQYLYYVYRYHTCDTIACANKNNFKDGSVHIIIITYEYEYFCLLILNRLTDHFDCLVQMNRSIEKTRRVNDFWKKKTNRFKHIALKSIQEQNNDNFP